MGPSSVPLASGGQRAPQHVAPRRLLGDPQNLHHATGGHAVVVGTGRNRPRAATRTPWSVGEALDYPGALRDRARRLRVVSRRVPCRSAARELLEMTFMPRMIAARGSLCTAAIATSPRGAEPRPGLPTTPMPRALELPRQGFRSEAFGVAEIAPARALVEPERQRGRQGDVDIGEVVAPARCSPVARSNARAPKTVTSDAFDAGVAERPPRAAMSRASISGSPRPTIHRFPSSTSSDPHRFGREKPGRDRRARRRSVSTAPSTARASGWRPAVGAPSPGADRAGSPRARRPPRSAGHRPGNPPAALIAQSPAIAAPPRWVQRVDSLVGDLPISVAVSLEGSPLYRHQDWVRRPPASNQKLLLSMALLKRIGADTTIPTRLFATEPVGSDERARREPVDRGPRRSGDRRPRHGRPRAVARRRRRRTRPRARLRCGGSCRAPLVGAGLARLLPRCLHRLADRADVPVQRGRGRAPSPRPRTPRCESPDEEARRHAASR